MKLLNYSALLALALLACPATSDKPFAPPKDKDGKPLKIKSAGNFGNDAATGAHLQLCPSGDCTSGQMMKLLMKRLEEVKPDGTPAGNKAENFQKTGVSWSDFTTVAIAGVNVSQTTYNAVLNVGNGKSNGTVAFNLTAQIFQGNASVPYAGTTITVPAGALKFTISMGAWPWVADTNMLQFGVQLVTRTKGGKDGPKPERLPRNETKKLERMNLTEGMFMDSPVVVLLDNVPTNVNSTITDTEFFWQFPHYTTSLYYDPVVGSEDASAQITTTTTTTDTTTNSAGSVMTVASSLLAAVGALFYLN